MSIQEIEQHRTGSPGNKYTLKKPDETYYIIESRILNHKGEEVNLQMNLSVVEFSGQLVYSIIFQNRNNSILIDKLKN